MTIFEKGNYQPISHEFRTQGIVALQGLAQFQEQFKKSDTDTTINEIRDAIIANYLGFDLLNTEKHGFDAKKSDSESFLEVKQCSISSKSWGGTWNDTNEEKAVAFSDSRLFTVVGIWSGASDLQFMVYGQNEELGRHLLSLVVNRKNGSRSTQSIPIQKLIKDYSFSVVCPPDKRCSDVFRLLINYKRDIIKYLAENDIKELRDIQ